MLKGSKSNDNLFENINKYANENNAKVQIKKIVKLEERVFGRDLKNENFNLINFRNPAKLKKQELINQKIKKEEKKEIPPPHEKEDKNYFLLSNGPKNPTKILDKKEQKYQNDPQYVTEYSNEIFDHLKKTENENTPDYPTLLLHQTKLKEKHRTILINFLVHVHMRFQLLPETLYLTINIIDRYICLTHNIEPSQLELIGISAMFIATKYEEIYAPEIQDFIFIASKPYSPEEILKTEYLIMKALKFDMLTISPYVFLVRFHFFTEDDKKTFYLSQYLLEASLIDINFCKMSSSFKAAACLFLARRLLKGETSWDATLKFQSGFGEKELKNGAKEILKFIKKSTEIFKDSNFYHKFNLKHFGKVSEMLCGLLGITIKKKGDKKES